MESTPAISRQLLNLSNEIDDGTVKRLFHQFFGILSCVHDDIRFVTTAVEVRAYFRDHTLCRAVPYRQLFHLQISESPTWEIRVRNETGFFEAFDRVLMRFLELEAMTADR